MTISSETKAKIDNLDTKIQLIKDQIERLKTKATSSDTTVENLKGAILHIRNLMGDMKNCFEEPSSDALVDLNAFKLYTKRFVDYAKALFETIQTIDPAFCPKSIDYKESLNNIKTKLSVLGTNVDGLKFTPSDATKPTFEDKSRWLTDIQTRVTTLNSDLMTFIATTEARVDELEKQLAT